MMCECLLCQFFTGISCWWTAEVEEMGFSASFLICAELKEWETVEMPICISYLAGFRLPPLCSYGKYLTI